MGQKGKSRRQFELNERLAIQEGIKNKESFVVIGLKIDRKGSSIGGEIQRWRRDHGDKPYDALIAHKDVRDVCKKRSINACINKQLNGFQKNSPAERQLLNVDEVSVLKMQIEILFDEITKIKEKLNGTKN
jgi:IS30 family transposase